MIPGPRPPKGHDRPSAGRDRGAPTTRPAAAAGKATEVAGVTVAHPVSLSRTTSGWSVTSPAGAEHATTWSRASRWPTWWPRSSAFSSSPTGTARRSARGPSGAAEEMSDPRRRPGRPNWSAPSPSSSTPWPPGSPPSGPSASWPSGTASASRAAFESLRGDARSQGRPVAQLAREVLDSLGPTPRIRRRRPTRHPARAHAASIVAAVPAPGPPRAGGHPFRRCGGRPVLTGPEPLSPSAPGRPSRRTPRRRAARGRRDRAARRRRRPRPRAAPAPRRGTPPASAARAAAAPAVVVPADGVLPAGVPAAGARADRSRRPLHRLAGRRRARPRGAEPAGARGGSGELPAGALGPRAGPRGAATRRPMPPTASLLVPGSLLQGVGLAFDVVVHLRVGPRPGGG